MMDRVRRRILLIYGVVLALGLAYTGLIFAVGHGVPCFFREITGYQCPGCGTSRMMLSLMRLDVAAAFRYNPVACVFLPLWVLVSALAFAGRPRIFRSSRFLLGILYVMIFCYCVQGVVRNL